MLSLAGLALGRAEIWTQDPNFRPAIESSDVVSAGARAYPGGKVLITSHPGIINGAAVRARIVRLNADGSLDNTFAGLPAGIILATYPDGRLLVTAPVVSGYSPSLIQRYLPDGTPDSSFTPVTIDYDSFSGRILPDGRILLSGNFSTVAGVSRRSLAMLLADGTLDSSFLSPFSANASPTINSVEAAADGQHIVVAGGGLGLGNGREYVARLNSDGSVDSGFAATDAGFSGLLGRAYPESNGGMLLKTSTSLVRLSSTGLKDSTFTPTLIGSSFTFGPRQPDGKIFYTAIVSGGSTTWELHRMNGDGSNDAGFAVISTPYVFTYNVTNPSICDDGTLILGSLTADRYAAGLAVSHVLADGSIDPAFSPRFGQFARPEACARQPDGKYLVAGRFGHVDNVVMPNQRNLVRLNSNGSFDAVLSAPLPSYGFRRIAIQPGGKILLFGTFPNASGGVDSVVRLNSDGTPDASFQPITQGALELSLTAMDKDGFIYAYTNASQLLRYSPNGVLDATFPAATFSSGLMAIVPLSNGFIQVASNKGAGIVSIFRLRHDGSIDPYYQQVDTSFYLTMAALPNGDLLRVDRFSSQVLNGYMTFVRQRFDGSTDYRYVSRPISSTALDPGIVLAAAGVYFDLLSEYVNGSEIFDSLSVGAGGEVTNLTVGTDGSLFHHFDSNFGSGPLEKYQRTTLTHPSVDAAPGVLRYSTTSALLRPLNSTFSIVVIPSGLEPMTFQWMKDGAPIPGKTSQSLSVRPLQAADAGSYSVRISNAYGSITSPATALTVDVDHASALIVTQPTGQSVPLGATAIFSVTATGNPAPTFQWWFNGSPIPGATGSTLILNNVQLANVGSYFVDVSNTVVNAAGSFGFGTQSAQVPLTIGSAAAPSITQHPSDQTILAGNPVTFTAAASGNPAPTYQWQRNGVDIAGATGASYTIASPTLADSGLYRVVATNIAGTAVSNGATLSVYYQPTISVQPASQTIVAGNPVTFTVGGSGVPIPTWQWRKDGVPIPGATGTTYTIPSVARSDAGNYTAVATNAAGTATSSVAVLTVQYAPVFTTQPVTHFVTVGANVPLSVTTDANPAATYQWRKDGVDIPGATSASYTITNAQFGDSASYTVVATNSVGSTTSNAGVLTVTVASLTPVPNDFNNDGKPDLVWRNTRTGAIAFWFMNGTVMQSATVIGSITSDWSIAGTGDFNNDGQTDLLWRKASSGAVAVWFMNGTAMQSSVTLGNITADWRIDGTGDFNGDGKVDILWRKDSSGAVALWLMDGTTILSTPIIANITYDWIIGGTGDFNGDGKVDILWRKESTGAVAFWLMDGMTILSTPIVANITADWKIAGSGDYNGDGETDIIWRKESTGLVAFWLMNDTAVQSTPITATITADWVICN